MKELQPQSKQLLQQMFLPRAVPYRKPPKHLAISTTNGLVVFLAGLSQTLEHSYSQGYNSTEFLVMLAQDGINQYFS